MKISHIQKLATIAVIALASCGGANTGSDSHSSGSANTGEHGGSEDITLESYNATIGEDKVTMVDFYATWCGPCKKMAPDVVKLKKEYAGQANVLQIDAEDKMDIASQYQLRGYPTIMFFKNGKTLESHAGLLTYDQLKSRIQKYMN